jgi:hypothetical protein
LIPPIHWIVSNPQLQTLSVLHATLLRPYEWMKELVVRRAACCEQWGKGRLPQVKISQMSLE